MRKILATSLIAFMVTTSLAAADASGVWAVSADIAGNALGATCTVTQASAMLTGACKGDLGESKLAGTVDGQKLKFQDDIEVQGMTLTLSFDGELDAAGKEAKGNVDVGGMANGTFSAKKQ